MPVFGVQRELRMVKDATNLQVTERLKSTVEEIAISRTLVKTMVILTRKNPS